MTNREGEGQEEGVGVEKGNHYSDILLGAGLSARQRRASSCPSRVLSARRGCPVLSCVCPIRACDHEASLQRAGGRRLAQSEAIQRSRSGGGTDIRGTTGPAKA